MEESEKTGKEEKSGKGRVNVGRMEGREDGRGGKDEKGRLVSEVGWKTTRREFRCPMSNQDFVSETTGF